MNKEIIEGLKDSLKQEYLAAFFMWQCQHNITGISPYQEYKHYFKHGFKEELGHLKIIAEQLHGYLEPVIVPTVEVPLFNTIKEMLEFQLDLEIAAVERYTELANIAEKDNNIAMVDLFSRLANEEESDRKEVIKRLGIYKE